MTLASRIAVMHAGMLQQFDEPKKVYDEPANIFVAGFMGSPSMNFIDGSITSVGDGAGIEISGIKAPLPIPSQKAQQLTAGQRVIVGLRPEHLGRLNFENPSSVGKLQGVVEVVEPTGAESIVVTRVGDKEIIARFEPDAAPTQGSNVELQIDMEKASLFDPKTEQRI